MPPFPWRPTVTTVRAMKGQKVRILVAGPCNAGKSLIANFLADMEYNLPMDLRPTKGLRILEFDLNDVPIDGVKRDIDIQLWDTSGDDKYSSHWAVFRKSTDGVMFVYSQEDDIGVRKLDYMYNYFVTQRNLSPRAVLVCSLPVEFSTAKLSTTFSKISQLKIDLETQGEKFKQDFTKFVISVVQNCKGNLGN